MPVLWTVEQVLALAPDPGSAKSGRELASPRKWKSAGANDVCAWGEIQGSGKDPYQTCIDLSEPAFKCTCPSRKFPCKHGLGLLLLLAQQPGAISSKVPPPPWAGEWLAKRVQRAEKKTAKAEQADAPPDPEAAARAAAAAEKRAEAREAKVSAGLRDLELWLQDLIRTGFATLPGKSSSFWETPAARLVDAQARGLARKVRELDGMTTTGESWPRHLLIELSWLHLACEGWSRMGSLAPETKADLQTAIGFTEKQEEILAQPGIGDHWMVLGQRVEEEELVRVQRTWLFGTATRRYAVSLSFSAGNQPLDKSLVPGTIIQAELVFFPGSAPMRALVKSRAGAPSELKKTSLHLPHATLSDANAFAAECFGANPWIERVPLGLAAVVPQRRDAVWLLRDEARSSLPLEVREEQGWRLLALSGGHPVGLFGEWNGETLRPLSVWVEGRFLRAFLKE